jgi:hypothetical protein
MTRSLRLHGCPNGVKGRFKKGQIANPGGRPKDLIGFRERCREKTIEVVEILETVFFIGHWPNRSKFVSDVVRMNAGMMLINHGWGVPPSSQDINISFPQLPPRDIDWTMSTMDATRLYEQTLRHGHFDDSGADQKLIDVTPEPDKPEGEDPK